MDQSSSVIKKRSEFSQRLAVDLIGVMSSTGTSFEMLAARINKSVEETRNLIYGFCDEMRVGDLQTIVKCMGYQIVFYPTINLEINPVIDLLYKPAPKRNLKSHLRLVKF